MIIDTSAVVAVINRESYAEPVEWLLASAARCHIGAPTRLECEIVLQAKFGIRGKTVLARFLQESDVHTVDFDARHVDIAADAYRRFGKGRHPARLNMGDCFTYATASVAKQPLLCVGEDFPQTDLDLVPVT